MAKLTILALLSILSYVPQTMAQSPVLPNGTIPFQLDTPSLSLPSPLTLPPDSTSQLSPDSPVSECVPPSTESDRIFIKAIEVIGSTVLRLEIQALIKPLENRELTFADLLCLRSKITELYLNQGYSNSGAFLPNNQDLSQGTVQIQVVEGKLERIDIIGLQRLQSNYVRSRLELAATTPLNQQRLQEALELLQLDPLFSQVNAELTAGSSPGQSILIVNLQEAPAFHATLGVDNYRPPSVGSTEGTVSISHNNLLGWGDYFYGEYNKTEGLNFYDLRYDVPINAQDGTVGIRYWNSTSGIIQEPFREFEIDSNNETLSFNIRQPMLKTPQEEVALGLLLDLRREQTFLLGQPFSFSIAADNGSTNLTVLRFIQEWVKRDPSRVLAVRSQFSFGLDLFDASINNLGIDGQFFSWQGQFQWVQQLSPSILLLGRIDTQLTPDALLPLEQFSLGGIDSVRGYPQNQLLTDNGIFASLEVRIPLTTDPSVLQLTPFMDAGTGWNNLLPNPDPSTLVGIGMGLRWFIGSGLSFRVDYGVPLISISNQGNSLQEQGFYFSLRYQPF
jgi:hemolysin activation/secretion protein